MAERAGGTDAWTIPYHAFPYDGLAAEKWRLLLRYAILAPSSHNTQPWLFRIDGDRLELYADTTRAIPVADPHCRELVLSCGAALFNLRVAMRHYQYAGEIEYFPRPDDPNLLARVGLGERISSTPDDDALFRSIQRRHTSRQLFRDQELLIETQESFCAAAELEGAWLAILKTQSQRTALITLIAEADEVLMGNKHYRAELANWLRPNLRVAVDGIPGHSLGLTDLQSSLAALKVRLLDRGRSQAGRDRVLAEQAPFLAVLGTRDDTPLDWLAAGQGLAHILLRARVQRIQASFFSQPVEIPSFRSRLGTLLQRKGFPQMVLRMGYTEDPRPTPRRGVDEVLQG